MRTITILYLLLMRNVLIIGADPEITTVIERLVNGFQGFRGEAITSIRDLALKLADSQFDVLLLGAGFTKAQETQIRETASSVAPYTRVIEHYGGGSGLLLEELKRE